MSISNLFTPNTYNLYCNVLTANNLVLPNDTPITDYGCSFYSDNGSGGSPYTLQRSGVTLKVGVHKNVLALYMGSSTGDFVINGNHSGLALGPFSDGAPTVLNIPFLINSNDGDMCCVINCKLPNDTVCKCVIDSNNASTPGNWLIRVYPISPDGGVTQKQFTNGTTCNFCNFIVFLPVVPVVPV